MNKQLEKLRAENAKDREHADKLLARVAAVKAAARK